MSTNLEQMDKGSNSQTISEPNRRGNKLMLVVLVLLFAYLLRWSELSTKTLLTHDESISYLAATCNQRNFQESSQRWLKAVAAAEWKAYYGIIKPFCYDEISDGLAQSDVHPPLYFWILHTWTLLFGVNIWTGPSLNIFISLMAAALLYKIALMTLRNNTLALLVLVTYTIGRSVISVSMVARQYELLALLTLLLLWLILRLTDVRWSFGGRILFLLGLVCLAGALTQFYFALPVSASIVYAAIKLWRSEKRRLAYITIIMLAGFLLSFLVFPHLSSLLKRLGAGSEPFNIGGFGNRIIITVNSFQYYYYVFFIAIGLAVIIFLARKRQQRWIGGWIGDGIAGQSVRVNWIWFFLFWIAGAIIIFYLSFRTPNHAMGAKYLSMVWPFIAFMPYFVLQMVNFRKSILVYLFLVPFLIGFGSLIENALPSAADPAEIYYDKDVVIFDTPASGILPALIFYVPDETLVVVGSQEKLAADPSSWMPLLTSQSLYVSTNEANSTVEGREILLDLLSKGGFEIDSSQLLPHIRYANAFTFKVGR